MAEFNVYERAGRYRIASPGWLLWHWYKYDPWGQEVNNFGDLSAVIYETEFLEVAQSRAASLNSVFENELKQHMDYYLDHWKLVDDGKKA
jgi:hypothetical protein